MLQQLRKGAKSIVAKVLGGLLVASFALWGIGDIFSFQLDSSVARVGDTKVPASRFADTLNREQNRLTAQSGQLVTYDMMRAAGLDRRILGNLIRDAAYEEELGGLGISAPDSAIADAIRSNPAFQDPGGKFSRQGYQFMLARQGFSEPEFEELTRTVLAQQILTETIEAGIPPLPGIAARVAAYQGEQRSVTIMTLTPDMAADPGMPDEDALRAFYDAHPAMFTEPERRWGQYIHVDAARLLKELAPDEATLRAAYDSNVAAYTTPATRTLDQLTYPDHATADAAVASLASGDASFESLAEKAGLAPGQSDLGTITHDDLPATAADLVFAATEPGIVGPVELPAGFAVYRVRETTPPSTTPFEDVREQIADELAMGKLNVRSPEVANLVEEYRAEGLPMAEIAAKAGASFGSFDGLAQDGTLANGTNAEGVLVSQTFLSETATALEGEERDMVELPDGGYILVSLQRVAPSALQPLEDVRDRAIAEWQKAERLEEIEAQGAELAARLGVDSSIWDLADELTVAALPLPPFTRLSPPGDIPPTMVDAIFKASTSGGVSGTAAGSDTVIVAQVSSATAAPPASLAQVSSDLDKELVSLVKGDTREYFSRAVEAGHGASIDPAVVEEVFRRLGASGTGS